MKKERHKNMICRRRVFTLLELLIVIGLLGALATLVLPSLAATKTEAFDPIVQNEMQTIRLAFQRFYCDVMPTDSQLDLFRQYDLAPLMRRELKDKDGNSVYSLDSWDADRQRGWRGPYLESESFRSVDDVNLPVIQDPYSRADNDGRYYRVLCPGAEGVWDHANMALVFIGYENNTLDSEARITADDSATCWEECYFKKCGTDDSEIIKRLVIDCDR